MNKILSVLFITALFFCGGLFPADSAFSNRSEPDQISLTPVRPSFMRLASRAEARPGTPVSIPVLLLIAFTYAALPAAGYLLLKKKTAAGIGERNFYFRAALTAVFAAGLVLRVILSITYHGHPVDIRNFSAWAIQAADRGLPGFYIGMFADYPPGYIYFLYIIGAVKKIFMLSQDSWLYILLLKLPAVIADTLTAFFLCRFAKKKSGAFTALVIGLLFMLSPAVILNSSVWGQMDSVFTLFILLMLFLLMEGKTVAASGLYSIALLIKPQALIFTPLLILAFIKEGRLRTFFAGAGFGLLVFIAGIIPFSIILGPLPVLKKYLDSLALYPYTSLNAAGLFSLFGLNWTDDSGLFLFLPYSFWGYIFIAAILAWTAALFFKYRGKEALPFIAFTLITAVFVLSVRMHERYLYPAIALGLAAFISIPDKRIFLLTGLLGVLHFLNTGYVFQFSMMNSFYIPRFDLFFLALSFLHTASLAWLVKTGYDLMIKNKQPLLFNPELKQAASKEGKENG